MTTHCSPRRDPRGRCSLPFSVFSSRFTPGLFLPVLTPSRLPWAWRLRPGLAGSAFIFPSSLHCLLLRPLEGALLPGPGRGRMHTSSRVTSPTHSRPGPTLTPDSRPGPTPSRVHIQATRAHTYPRPGSLPNTLTPRPPQTAHMGLLAHSHSRPPSPHAGHTRLRARSSSQQLRVCAGTGAAGLGVLPSLQALAFLCCPHRQGHQGLENMEVLGLRVSLLLCGKSLLAAGAPGVKAGGAASHQLTRPFPLFHLAPSQGRGA